MSRFSVCIIGDGAIGSLFTAFASENGVGVYRGLREGKSGVKRVASFDGEALSVNATDIRKSSQPPSCDLVVLPVKVYQLASALKEWKTIIGKTPVLLLQNGMGGEEIARNILPGQRIYQATTSHGALKIDADKVRHTGRGQTLAGRSATTIADKDSDNLIRQIVETAFPPVQWCEDINLALWQKLSVNLAINPLTAIHDIPNGDILQPRFEETLNRLSEETSQVMQACGIHEDSATILNRIKAIAKATASNYSSMHQDVAHQRQTEIDAITGYLIVQAEMHNIAVPAHRQLYQQINQQH